MTDILGDFYCNLGKDLNRRLQELVDQQLNSVEETMLSWTKLTEFVDNTELRVLNNQDDYLGASRNKQKLYDSFRSVSK